MRYAAAVEEAVSGRLAPTDQLHGMIGRDMPHLALRRQGYICDARQSPGQCAGGAGIRRIAGPWRKFTAGPRQRFVANPGMDGSSARRRGNGARPHRRSDPSGRRLRGFLARRRGRSGGKDFVSRPDETTGTGLVAIRLSWPSPGLHAAELLRLVRARGLAGELYWAVLYPIHVLIFRGMVKAIARQSEDNFRLTGRCLSEKLRKREGVWRSLGTGPA